MKGLSYLTFAIVVCFYSTEVHHDVGLRVGPEKNLPLLPLTFRKGPNQLRPSGLWGLSVKPRSLLWTWLQPEE